MVSCSVPAGAGGAENRPPAGILAEHLGPAPIESATPEQVALYEKAKADILRRAARPPRVLAETSEAYFWYMSAQMAPLLEAYEYSRDPVLIEAFVPLMKFTLGQRYVHPTRPEVWSGWYHYRNNLLKYMPIHAAIAYYNPTLKFISAVRADERLKAKYGELAEAWYRDITEVSIPAWDLRGTWHDYGDGAGWYTHTTHYPDAQTGRLIERTDRYAGSSLAYNKVHKLIETFVLLYRMTGDEWCLDRIRKCETFFRRRWRADERHVEWNYRDFSGPWDYVNGRDGRTKTNYFIHPKGGYYASDLVCIVECYNAGVFFTADDIRALTKTNLQFMWNGDAADPKFTQINGRRIEQGKYNKGRLWTSLAQFDGQVRQLWEAQLRKSKWPSSSTIRYLLTVSRPVSMEPLHATEPPRPPSRR